MHFNKIKNIITKSSDRSKLILKNIIASSLLRVVSIIISMLVVPLTIGYINSEKYGIWLTLSSIIVWLSYFDFGFAHGFRNRFAESIAKGDILLAKKYVSTTYFVIGIVFSIVMLIALGVNELINWSKILNVDESLSSELNLVFQSLIIFFCIKMVVDVFLIMLNAYQRPAISAAITTLGNFVSLIIIFVLSKCVEGNLPILAISFFGVPCILTFIISVLFFKLKDYKIYSPEIRFIDLSLVKSIFGIGAQFFIIMMSMLLIFQFINIIISRELGPESVTIYNVTYKYFSILEMGILIIMTPIWSAVTDAYTKKDYNWMRSIAHKLEMIGLLCIPALIIMVLVSDCFFNIWLGDSVEIDLFFSISMAFFVFTKIMGTIYMYQINGTGKVYMQLISYLIMSIFALPCLSYGCELYGLIGVVIIPSMVYLVQFLICRLQLFKIINGQAKGLWIK